MNDGYVLDSSAVLCVLANEEGTAAINHILPYAVMSAVNLAEVIAKLQERGATDEIIEGSLADLNISVIDFDKQQADKTGKLRLATRSRGLSLGDRACLALAASRGAIAVTTDKAWKDLDGSIHIMLVR